MNPHHDIATCCSHLLLAIYLILLAGCASSPAGSPPAGAGHAGLEVAAGMIGKPYRYGGTTPHGFDCSGLVYYAYRQAGIAVPRTTQEQYRHAERIAMSRIRPGDLLFFRIQNRNISHVAIYAGQGRILHAPSSGRQVTYSTLDSPYWRQHLAAAGRYE
jgi:cell wall-associated NlpC family hydrolase